MGIDATRALAEAGDQVLRVVGSMSLRLFVTVSAYPQYAVQRH